MAGGNSVCFLYAAVLYRVMASDGGAILLLFKKYVGM